MGYIFLLVIGVVVVVFVLAAFVKGERRPTGKAMRGQDVTMKIPAADDPTPGDHHTGIAS
jgi:hypothetical protein